MKKILLLIVFILVVCMSWAETGYYRRADFMLMNSSAAAAALSGAVTARQGGISSMTYNPAGVYGLKTFDVSLNYSINGLNGLNGTYTIAAMPTQYGVFGVSYMFNREDYKGSQVNNRVFLINYSSEIIDYMNVGLNAKYAVSSRLSETAGFIAFDLGLQYRLDDFITVAICASDVGCEVSTFNDYSYYAKTAVPALIKAGIDCVAVNDNMNKFELGADAGFGIFGSTISFSTGAEYVYLKQFYIRAGAKTERIEDEASYNSFISAGLGMNYELNGSNFNLEYSYVPKIAGKDGFGETQVISITGMF